MRAADGEAALVQLRDWSAEVAVVLGSGLAAAVGTGAEAIVIPYSQVPGVPEISVSGHLGRFVLDQIGTRRVIFAQGRVHLYEGRSPQDVAAVVRTLAHAGVKTVVLTNAAGSVNRSFAAGEWMMIRDHLNLTGTSPLVGGAEFVDMTDAYSPRLRSVFGEAAATLNLPLHEGVYAGMAGPQYETAAEVRMLQTMGADAVGMSTVLEAIQARALGLDVAAFSCLTNLGTGIAETKLSHGEVLATGRGAADVFAQLLNAAMPRLRV